jgi:hypothetical protein
MIERVCSWKVVGTLPFDKLRAGRPCICSGQVFPFIVFSAAVEYDMHSEFKTASSAIGFVNWQIAELQN